MTARWVARLNPWSERAEAWLRVWGTLEIPVLSDVAVWHGGPDGMRWWFRADLNALEPAQIERFVAFASERFGIKSQEIIDELPSVGIPILADDVTIVLEDAAP